MSRALVFLLYDREGICDESTLHTMAGFRPHVDRLVVVSNGKLTDESRTRVSEISDEVIERENVGYDVGAYRQAFETIGWEKIAEFDELLLVNYTFFGPVGSFEPILQRMSDSKADFWGITEHPSVTPHPYLGKGTMPAHLQSFWLGIKQSILKDPSFRRYWHELDDPKSYNDVVVKFETQFTEHFSNLGFEWEAAFPSSRYGVANPAMQAPISLLKDGCPLFKKRLYFHDAPWLAKQGVLSGAVTAQAVQGGYPEELVVEGVRRRTSARELSLGMDATFLIPEVSDDEREAREAELSSCTVMGSPWRQLAQEGVQELMGDASFLIVDAEAPQTGNLSDGVVLAYANAHSAIVENQKIVDDIFIEHPRMAALFPNINLLSEPVFGTKWFPRMQASREVAELLDLEGPFSQTSALAPWKGIAAYRREFLEDVAALIKNAGGWQALLEVVPKERNLVAILDLLAGDIAKDNGYFVGQAGSADELRRTLSVLQDTYSRGPYVQPGYLDYPYSGAVMMPSLKNRIGAAVKRRSPGAFDRLHSVELRVRNLVRKSSGGKK